MVYDAAPSNIVSSQHTRCLIRAWDGRPQSSCAHENRGVRRLPTHKQRITIEFVRIDGDAFFSPLPLSGFTGELPLSASGLMHGGRIHRQPVAAL